MKKAKKADKPAKTEAVEAKPDPTPEPNPTLESKPEPNPTSEPEANPKPEPRPEPKAEPAVATAVELPRHRVARREGSHAMRSSSLLAAVVVAVATTLAAAPVAHAQIADALGRPLPSNDLPTGTIVVKVIAGMVTKPVIGTEVTLVVNGTPRAARTDSEGHAAFPDLPPGATVQAKVLDDDKKEVTSSEFQVPEDSGARVMITTAPFQPLGGGGGAPFAGGMGGGMPDPRQVSGQPRPEQKNAPGEAHRAGLLR